MTTEQWERENQDTLMEYFIDGDPSVRRIQCELRVYGGYQNGNSHFCTIKRYDCLVGDQNDHQLKSVRYGWVVSGQFVYLPLPSGELRFS